MSQNSFGGIPDVRAQDLFTAEDYLAHYLVSPNSTGDGPVPSFDLANLRVDTTISAIFVAHFDARKGSYLEWHYPYTQSLLGVEFQALASGLHHSTKDYVLFRSPESGKYAISCFHALPVDSLEERNVRMRSVGVVVNDSRSLVYHMNFLQGAVEMLNNTIGHDRFERLIEYYESHKEKSDDGTDVTQQQSATHETSIAVTEIQRLEITTKVASVYELVKAFGVNVFLIWKALLLQRRILFFSPNNIGALCSFAHSSSLLQTTAISVRDAMRFPEELSLVTLHDFDTLRSTASGFFVAATSEKILERQYHKFDVFIDEREFQCNQQDKELFRITKADENRFSDLQKLLSNDSRHKQSHINTVSFDNNTTETEDERQQLIGSSSSIAVDDESSGSDGVAIAAITNASGVLDEEDSLIFKETALRRYFMALNTKLLDSLQMLSHLESVEEEELIEQLGLDEADAPFLSALSEMHNLSMVIIPRKRWLCC